MTSVPRMVIDKSNQIALALFEFFRTGIWLAMRHPMMTNSHIEDSDNIYRAKKRHNWLYIKVLPIMQHM